mmetsp:Transcript_155530/g.270557  ORF Transcript_155530/g.270557 Transcript_155530/m.270557 type:complete len:226 (+) Transcript_155530:220-897(+)
MSRIISSWPRLRPSSKHGDNFFHLPRVNKLCCQFFQAPPKAHFSVATQRSVKIYVRLLWVTTKPWRCLVPKIHTHHLAIRRRRQHLDVVPPAWWYSDDIARADNGLQTLTLELCIPWKGFQIWLVEIHAALPILRMVNRPRIEAAEVLWVEEENALQPSNLCKKVVLRIIMARREPALSTTEKLAHLWVAALHELPQPIPSELLDILHDLHSTSSPKSADRLRLA